MLIYLDKTQSMFLYIAKKKVQDSIETDDWQTDDRERLKHVLLTVLTQVLISKSTFKLFNSKCLCTMFIEIIINTILKFFTIHKFFLQTTQSALN